MNKVTVDRNPKYKEAFSLMMQGLKFKQIAEKMGIAPGAASDYAQGYERVYGDLYYVRWMVPNGERFYELFRAGSLERLERIMAIYFGNVEFLSYGRADSELGFVEQQIRELEVELAGLKQKRDDLKFYAERKDSIKEIQRREE